MAPLAIPSLLLLLAALCLAEVISLTQSQPPSPITDLSTRVIPRKAHNVFTTSDNGGHILPDDNLQLHDIVLLASVDGKLHALNRTTGAPLWSMSSPASTSSSVRTTTLGPLIRSNHPPLDQHEESTQEVYIIEPQSGDIYVMSPSSPSSPLQRLPLSMADLVEMSPYSISGEDGTKVFVGKKETSLLLVELETGIIKATLDLNSECPWDPFENLSHDGEEDGEPYEDLDLDELDGTKPPKVQHKSTEVFIGRTDYHISIHTRPLHSSIPRPPVQNLSFSTYGPNNQDVAIQAMYRRTADDVYIQSLPNGKVIAFRASLDENEEGEKANAGTLWGSGFSSPVVAVFDVVSNPASSRTHPFVLLQPHLTLPDLLPSSLQHPTAAAASMPNTQAAYIGLVEETGSLFAMSPDRYPLVVFGDSNYADLSDSDTGGLGRSIDPPSVAREGLELDLDLNLGLDIDVDVNAPSSVDSVTQALKRRALRKMCRQAAAEGVVRDKRCLTGVRRLESSRLSRLLEGATVVPKLPYGYNNGNSNGDGWGQSPVQGPQLDLPQDNSSERSKQQPEKGNSSVTPSRPGYTEPSRPTLGYGLGVPFSSQALSTYAVGVLTLMLGLIWIYWKKASPVASSQVSEVSSDNVRDYASQDTKADLLADGEQKPKERPSPLSLEQWNGTPSSPPTPVATPISFPTSSAATPAPKPQQKRKVSFGDAIKVPASGSGDADDADQGDDSEGDVDGEGAPNTPGKKKGMRRKRGKKKKGAVSSGANGESKAEEGPEEGNGEVGTPKLEATGTLHVTSPSSAVVPPPTPSEVVVPSLVVSDNILGFGSHGTVVFKGSLQGRAVAVKRLLRDFVTIASREVAVLQESDDHPNVIRYYYQESQANFLYIALELCPASLADVIERPDLFRDIVVAFDPKKALRQITSGLRHLHALKIIHRDIKPQNILVSSAKKGVGDNAGHRMLISDFGLCKKLETDQTSFLPTAHGAVAAGTFGWRAPEILRGEVTLDVSGNEDSQSSRGSVSSSGDGVGTPTGKPTRLTKLVDIFALGCLYYYVLTNGGHPFGERYEREVNIFKNEKNLEGLERFGEEGTEAVDLIARMLSPEPYERPDTSKCLIHPYFWDAGKRLNFLQDASDRFEIMCRDPRDFMLIELEKGAQGVVGNDWQARLDKWFIENLGKYRKYDGKSVQDLMRALRNKKHHYQDLPDSAKRQVGSMPEGFLSYFTKRFPRLFLHVHKVVEQSPLRTESMFRTYFQLTE